MQENIYFEEKFLSSKRVTHLSLMLAATLAATVGIALIKGAGVDIVIAACALDIVYFALLVAGLILKRKRGFLAHPQVSYGKLCLTYVLCCALSVAFSLMPAFTRPMILLAFFLYMLSQEGIAVYITLYLSTMLCVLCDSTVFELASYAVMVSGAIFLLTLIKEKKHQIYVCFSLLALGMLIPCIFYYLAFSGLDQWVFLIDGIGAVVTCLAALALFNPIRTYVSREEEAILEVIIMENYALVRDIKAFSKKEYDHALRVMKLAGKCAVACGVNEKVCAAGGFYYRVGIMEGEPFVENGVRLALNKGFPEAVVRILAEYNGEEYLPSSVESAIVHMVNTVVSRVEELHGDNKHTSWNQNVVIYQTLNEISASGFYDLSTMSMNQFLKTRDILAVEENLL